jgi:hypothetical protein
MSLTRDIARPSLVMNDNTPQQRRLAARHVASRARDARECAEMLSMLGLTADDGLSRKE